MEQAVEKKEPRTTKQKVFLGLEIFGNVVFYGVIVFLLLFAIFNINGGNGKKSFPNLFGKGALSVQSDSMSHDSEYEELIEWKDYKLSNGFEKGDLLTDKVFKKKTTKSLKVGDVITFYDRNLDALNTHRIVKIVDDFNVITQGDKTAMETSYSIGAGKVIAQAYILIGSERATNSGLTEAQINTHNYTLEANGMIENVAVGNIKGIAISVNKGGGKVLDNIQDNYLFYFVLPVAFLLIIEVFLVIRNILIIRGEKNVAALDDRKEEIIAEEKERMRLELLAEMYGGLENVPEEMKNPKKVETPEEEKVEEASGAVENSEETNNEDAKAAEKVTESNEEVKTETTEEVVEKEPEVESDVEPQEENKEENN